MILTRKTFTKKNNRKKIFRKYKNNRKKTLRKYKNNRKKTKKKNVGVRGGAPHIDFDSSTKPIISQIQKTELLNSIKELDAFLQANKHEIKGQEANKHLSSYLFYKLFDKKNREISKKLSSSIDMFKYIQTYLNYSEDSRAQKSSRFYRLEKRGQFFIKLLYHLHDIPNSRTPSQQIDKPGKALTLQDIFHEIGEIELYNKNKHLVAIPTNQTFIKLYDADTGEKIYFMVEDEDKSTFGYDEDYITFSETEIINKLKYLATTSKTGLKILT